MADAIVPVTHKTGLPTVVTVDHEQFILTPQWDSREGESVRVAMATPVNLTESGSAELHEAIAGLLDVWRPVWPLVKGEAVVS